MKDREHLSERFPLDKSWPTGNFGGSYSTEKVVEIHNIGGFAVGLIQTFYHGTFLRGGGIEWRFVASDGESLYCSKEYHTGGLPSLTPDEIVRRGEAIEIHILERKTVGNGWRPSELLEWVPCNRG